MLRAGETRDFTLVLAEFEPPIAYVETYQDVPRLRIASFSKDTATVVGKLLESIEGSELLIDVRGAAFGDVEHAYDVAKLFAGGDLGFLMKRDEKLETYSGATTKNWPRQGGGAGRSRHAGSGRGVRPDPAPERRMRSWSVNRRSASPAAAR